MAVMKVPDKVYLEVAVGDPLTLEFTKRVHLRWLKNPNLFHDGTGQPFPDGQDRDGNSPWGPGYTDSSHLGEYSIFVDLPPQSLPEHISSLSKLIPLLSVHVIHIGSTSLALREILTELKESEGGFCKNWECAERLLVDILQSGSKVIPVAARQFIELLIKTGNAVCGSESKKPEQR